MEPGDDSVTIATTLEMFLEKFIEFELIIAELCSFMYLLNLLIQLVTSQLLLNQQFIFCTFLQITSELKEIVYYSKRPISLLFHALSHETIKILLLISFKYFSAFVLIATACHKFQDFMCILVPCTPCLKVAEIYAA